MKKASRLSLIIMLEFIAIEIGAYTYAALLYHERLHVLLLTELLCLLAIMIGTIVTCAKAQVVSCASLVLGSIMLCLGLYFHFVLHYHERAYLVMGAGLLGLLGGLAGLLMPRSIVAALYGLLVLGIGALSTGLYLLSVLGHHGRAYLVLGTGILCLLGCLVGLTVTRYKTPTVVW